MVTQKLDKHAPELAALLRAHPNWYIFPIRAFEKDPPCIKNNLELASNDPSVIFKWWLSYVYCNWGLALRKSRTIVVDVDTKPGKVGRDTLDNLEILHGRLPETYTVRTPSGGFHHYFDEANGVQHACRLGVHGFGTDIDSPNYVLLAGCRIATGSYTVHNSAPVAPAPSWFAEYLRPSNMQDPVDQATAVELDTEANVTRAIDYLKRDAPPSIEGRGGEHTLLMVAATLKDMGISEWQSVELLADYYNVPGKCDPLWSVGDGETADRLDIKTHNAWKYLHQNKPGALTAEACFADDAEPDVWVPPSVHPSAVEAQRKFKARIEAKAKASERLTELRRRNPEAYAQRRRRWGR